MTALTKAKVEKFIRIRNKSRFNSNLQFQIDAQEAGIRMDDLPKAEPLEIGAYAWDLGKLGRLVERNGKLILHPPT